MTYFENIKSYVGFAETDQQALGQLADSAETSYAGFAEHFYECISRHPDAHKVLDGAEQIARLKNSLVRWMRSGLRGPHDETFFERRCRIGRVHVRIGLPQQYMFTAMNVLRLDFHHLIRRTYSGDIERERSAHDAVDKLFDLELAIMLHTYRDDSEERMRRAERLATIGQIAASIGHDLRNPLSVIQSSMYILRKRTNDDPRSARHIDRIDTQVEICGSIISNLMELARSNPPRAELIDFTAIFDQVRASLQIPTSVAVDMQTTEDTTLYADA
ncbi:MAG: protoglobin domain-containing protein, partial [Myxococcota bacterium]